MNMPQPAPQGQDQGQSQGQGQPQGQQNPIIQALQVLGQFVQRLGQRDPKAAAAATKTLDQFISIIKGEGQNNESEGPQEQQQEGEPPAPPTSGKKMGPMPMNAKRGAVPVL